MTRYRIYRAAIALIGLFATRCYLLPPALTDNGRGDTPDLKREVFVLYGLAETLTIINPRYAGEGPVSGNLDPDDYIVGATEPDPSIVVHYSGQTGNGFLHSGRWPNQILIHGNRLYIVASGENRINCYHESTLSEAGSITLPKGCNPYSLISDPYRPGILWVSGFADNSVYAIDSGLMQVTARIDLNDPDGPGPSVTGPEGLLWQDNKLYVACSGWNQSQNDYGTGTIAVIEESGGDFIVSGKIATATNPQSLVPFPAFGEIHAVCTGYSSDDDGTLTVIRTTQGSPDEDTVIGTHALGGSPLYSPGGTDPATGTVWLSGTGGIRSYRRDNSGLTVIRGTGGDPPLVSPAAGGNGAWYASVILDTVNHKILAADFGKDALDLFMLDETAPFLDRIDLLDGPLALTLGEE